MRIYLAARYSRRQELQGYAATLREMGHVVTSRWLLPGEHEGEADPDTELGVDRMARYAFEDLLDVDDSDTVVVFTEQRGIYSSGGRHVEFGYAIARNKSIIIVGPIENVFHALDGLVHHPDFESLRKDIYYA